MVFRSLVLILIFGMFFSTVSFGASIVVTSPTAGAVVSGPLALSAQTDIPGVSRVAYLLDGKPIQELGSPIDVPSSPPFAYTYRTEYLFSGERTLVAVAYAADGSELARSAAVPVRIATTPYSVFFTGFDPAAPVNGIVSWISYLNTTSSLAGRTCAIDGLVMSPYDSNLISDFQIQFGNLQTSGYSSFLIRFNSSRFPNGAHEFACVFSANQAPLFTQVGWQPSATLVKSVTFDNGHTPMALRLAWQDIYLTTGERLSLQPAIAYTDGTQDPPSMIGISIGNTNASVASVDSNGVVSALSPGITTLTVTNGVFTTRVRIVVESARIFRHFLRNGTISDVFVPNQSLFMRYLFFLNGIDYLNYPSTGNDWKTAGITTMGTGFFPPGRYSPTDPQGDYSTWYGSPGCCGYGQSWFTYTLEPAQALNMTLFATGDGAFRSPQGLHDIITTPWRKDAVETMVRDMRDSNRVIGIDMIDETNYILGSYPFPPGAVNASGPFTKIEVFGCPSIPCTGTGIVHYRYNSIFPGSLFHIQGSRIDGLNGPHLVDYGQHAVQISAVPATDTINLPGHLLTQNGIPARFSLGGPVEIPRQMPAGLFENVTYYLIVVDANTLRVAATLSDALANISIPFSTTGSGVYLSYGAVAEGDPFNALPKVAWTFTTRDVPNGVYDAVTDPQLQVVIWNSVSWFQFSVQGKRIGTTGPASLSITNGEATALWQGHGLADNQTIQITGSATPALNRPYRVKVINATSFTFLTIAVPDGFITAANDPGLSVDIGFFPPWNNDLVRDVISIMDRVPGRPPLSWPSLGLSNDETFQNWIGDPRASQFNSLYFSPDGRFSDFGPTIYQTYTDIRAAFFGRLAYIQRQEPKIILTGLGTYVYTKRVPGTEFQYGSDTLEFPVGSPDLVSLQIMLAASSGMAGVRAYGYDDRTSASGNRGAAGIGQEHIQVQVSPLVQPKKWQAMSRAFNLIGELEPYVLQPQASSPDLGKFFFTAVKQGNGARLLMATNIAEIQNRATINFAPYTFNGSVVRYRITGSRSDMQTISGQNETIVFEPSQTIVWLFRPGNAATRILVVNPEGLVLKNITGRIEFLNTISRQMILSVNFTANQSGFVNFLLPSGLPSFVDLRVVVLGYIPSGIRNHDTLSSLADIPPMDLLVGDFNGDGSVNSLDWSVMNRNWFGSHPLADINRDGVVNSLDFSFVSRNWLRRGD